MTYSEAIDRIEAIIDYLENAGALPFDVYRKNEQEANRLLNFCEKQLYAFETKANADFSKKEKTKTATTDTTS